MRLLQRWISTLMQSAQPPYVSGFSLKGGKRQCEVTNFKSPDEFMFHVLKEHFFGMRSSIPGLYTCRIPPCFDHSRSLHPNPQKYGFLMYWCYLYEGWRSRVEENLENHYKNHLPLADSICLNQGYAGHWIGERCSQPSLCPFYIRDVSKSMGDRLFVPNRKQGHEKHVENHIKKIDNKVLHPCPASASTCDGIPATCVIELMSKSTLADHILDVHGIQIFTKNILKRGGKARVDRKGKDPISVANLPGHTI